VQCLGQPTWHKQTFPGLGLNQEIRLVFREMWRIEELGQPPLGWPLWLKDQVCPSLGVSKFKQQEISGFLFTNSHKLSNSEGPSDEETRYVQNKIPGKSFQKPSMMCSYRRSTHPYLGLY